MKKGGCTWRLENERDGNSEREMRLVAVVVVDLIRLGVIMLEMKKMIKLSE